MIAVTTATVIGSPPTSDSATSLSTGGNYASTSASFPFTSLTSSCSEYPRSAPPAGRRTQVAAPGGRHPQLAATLRGVCIP
mmetsp:Transcript_11256/g.28427  ORF Transcript_11256/g.28427 Transcript_11256/m.28427 type:complete len:81 (+) Transcript_11256:845-1087(+)